jgi:hypothetical protein
MSPAPEPVGVDLGTTGGDWLIKQGDLLLGPVPAKVLVDKLYRGEIDAQTLVAPAGEEQFTPIEQVAFFKVHAKKAQVKVKLERTAEYQKIEATHQRNNKLIGMVVAGVLVLALGGYGANWLAVNKPWRNANDEDLELAINVEAPQIALAGTTKTPDDEIALPINTTAGATNGSTNPNKNKIPKRPGTTGKTSAGSAPTPNAGEPDGLQTAQFDQSSIQDVVSAQTKTLYPCIKAEAKAHPGTGGHVPIEFTVGNDGRVAKLWIDNADYKSGPLYDCFLKTLKTWPFKAYQGEQANVSLNFSWGPKS